MLKTKIVYEIVLGICLLSFVLPKQANAQIVIGKPNLGFSQACANEFFNTFNTTFVFSPENGLNPSNQFSIELSDADGDFANAEIIYTSSSGEVTQSPATLTFALPLTTAGENYSIRITSNNPTATSSPSDSFPAYYKVHDEPFTINNLVSTGAFCAGGSYLLSIDNPGSGNNDSPLNYPTLTFNWYKETSPTTAVFIAEGPTLSVSDEGTYFVETNYGTCTSDSFSNRVTIFEVSSGEAEVGIASSLGNPFCPSQGATTLTTIGGLSYQWFRDDVPISEATEQSYQTDEPGIYAVQVDLGDCSASGSIDLVSELFDAELNVPDINYLDEGESLFVMVTTSAITPEFEWYFNDSLIAEATTESYEVSQFGNYKIIITDESFGCDGYLQLDFEVREAFPDVDRIPNIISPNGDGINDTWIIPPEYVSGTNTSVLIMSNRGKVVFQTNDYLNNWPENSMSQIQMNQVFYYVITSENKTKKGSITVLK